MRRCYRSATAGIEACVDPTIDAGVDPTIDGDDEYQYRRGR